MAPCRLTVDTSQCIMLLRLLTCCLMIGVQNVEMGRDNKSGADTTECRQALHFMYYLG